MKWNSNRHHLLFILILILVSCDGAIKPPLKSMEANFLDGTSGILSNKNKLTTKVFVFLIPDCPLCINYTLTVSKMSAAYIDKGVEFYAVFPGIFYSDSEIRKFQNDNNFFMDAIVDRNYNFTKNLGASIAPQVVVTNQDDLIVYSGAIDNWAHDIGQKRQAATEFYLENALKSILSGNLPSPNSTKAFGCYIE